MQRTKLRITEAERAHLETLLHQGQHPARMLTRARILLKTADGWSVERIADALDVCPATVSNTRRRYQQGGIERVLTDVPPTPHRPALDRDGEAVLLAVACSAVPDGMIIGRCACSKASSLSWEWSRGFRWRRSMPRSKKRAQAVAARALVPPAGRCGVRSSDGRCAGPV